MYQPPNFGFPFPLRSGSQATIFTLISHFLSQPHVLNLLHSSFYEVTPVNALFSSVSTEEQVPTCNRTLRVSWGPYATPCAKCNTTEVVRRVIYMTEKCFDSRASLLNQRSKRNMVELVIVVTLRLTYSIYSQTAVLPIHRHVQSQQTLFTNHLTLMMWHISDWKGKKIVNNCWWFRTSS